MQIKKIIFLFLFICTGLISSCGSSGSLGVDSDGTTDDGGGDTSSTAAPFLASAISASDLASLAVASDGTVWEWGVELNDVIENQVPVQAVGPNNEGYLSNIVNISSNKADSHRHAISDSGSLWAWGIDAALGNGNVETSLWPMLVSGITDVVEVSGGSGFTVALKSDGTVWAWGGNSSHELGNGSEEDSYVPIQVHGPNNEGHLGNIVKISTGFLYSLALMSDGTVWSWGCDSRGYGVLGLGDDFGACLLGESPEFPQQVHGQDDSGFLTGVTSIVSGDDHNLALKSDGTVWAWGKNEEGQLGDGFDGFNEDRASPVQVRGPDGVGFLTDVSFIAAGRNHSIAVKKDGTVWGWGLDDYEQIGEVGSPHLLFPRQITGISDVVSIAGGDRHTIALKSDGTVWGWGDNTHGQLGSGKDDQSPVITPVQVTTKCQEDSCTELAGDQF